MSAATLDHIGMLVDSEAARATPRWWTARSGILDAFIRAGSFGGSRYNLTLAEALNTYMIELTPHVFEVADREALRCAVPLEQARELVIEKLRQHFTALARDAGTKGEAFQSSMDKTVLDNAQFAFQEFDRRAELYRVGMFKPEGPTPVTSYTITQSGSGNALNANVASPGASIISSSNALIEAVREVEAQLQDSGFEGDAAEELQEVVRLMTEQAGKPKVNRSLFGGLLDGVHKLMGIAGTAVRPEFVAAVGRVGDAFQAIT